MQKKEVTIDSVEGKEAAMAAFERARKMYDEKFGKKDN